ncbi:hypothetical protein HK098_003137 [Nowakowskiella sp. JEL0407]|nr:hypothetical protein HK098_003137 [Nowakowskiella sp. JEL0407]
MLKSNLNLSSALRLYKSRQSSLSHSFQTRSLKTIGKTGGQLVILGTGWAGFKVLGNINTEKYDVIVVSPRNYFAFTPLLASTAVGTLEFRAISEPVRAYQNNITYYQAWCDKIDFENKTLTCTTALPQKQDSFTISFDKLVISTGAYANTFGIPGVAENAFFLREVEHARRIRNRIIECMFCFSESQDCGW